MNKDIIDCVVLSMMVTRAISYTITKAPPFYRFKRQTSLIAENSSKEIL